MPKMLTKIIYVLFGASVFCAAVLRCVQMFRYTDASTGFILRGAEKTIALFFVLCAAAVLLCSAFLSKKISFKNPFAKHKSKVVFYSCIFAAIAMFYDFVHQCMNCYKYISENTHFKMNYFLRP